MGPDQAGQQRNHDGMPVVLALPDRAARENYDQATGEPADSRQ